MLSRRSRSESREDAERPWLASDERCEGRRATAAPRARFGELLWDLSRRARVLGGAPANFAFRAQSLGPRAASRDARRTRQARARAPSSPWADSALTHPASRSTTADRRGPSPSRSCPTAATSSRSSPTSRTTASRRPLGARLGRRGRRSLFRDAGPAVGGESCGLAALLAAARAPVRRARRQPQARLLHRSRRLRSSLQRATVVKLSEDEAAEVARAIPGAGPRNPGVLYGCRPELPDHCCVVTLGDRGAFAASSRASRLCPGHRVNVVDTIGSGDAFTAGFVAAILAGRLAAEACERGTRPRRASSPLSGGPPRRSRLESRRCARRLELARARSTRRSPASSLREAATRGASRHRGMALRAIGSPSRDLREPRRAIIASGLLHHADADPRRAPGGADGRRAHPLAGGYVLVEDDRVVAVGSAAPSRRDASRRIDATRQGRAARPRQHPPPPAPDADAQRPARPGGAALRLAGRALRGVARPRRGRGHGRRARRPRRAAAHRLHHHHRPPLPLPAGQERFIDVEIDAARELGIRFHPTRGSMSRGRARAACRPTTCARTRRRSSPTRGA